MTSDFESQAMPAPEPARPLIRELLQWVDHPDKPPLVHVNSVEPFARYLLSLMIDRAAYVRLEGHITTADDLCATLEGPLQRLTNDFDRAFFIIDEADRAEDEALLEAIRRLLAERPTLRLILFGRSIPATLRREPSLKGQISFIPTKGDSPRGPHLNIRALGTIVIEHDGVPVTNWGGRQTRLLFLFCIDRVIVDRRTIFDAFWPGDTIKNATNVFHVTKLKVRNILGGRDLLKFSGGLYRIDPMWEVSYDVEQFIDRVQRSEAAEMVDQAEAERLLKEAVMLYQGDYLSGLNEPWVLQRRSQLRSMMSEVLMQLAGYAGQRSNAAEAVSLLRQSVRFDPSNTLALTALVDALIAQGDLADAKLVLQQSAFTHENDGRQPDPELQRRFDQLFGSAGMAATD